MVNGKVREEPPWVECPCLEGRRADFVTVLIPCMDQGIEEQSPSTSIFCNERERSCKILLCHFLFRYTTAIISFYINPERKS